MRMPTIEAAGKTGKQPDTLYALELLDNTTLPSVQHSKNLYCHQHQLQQIVSFSHTNPVNINAFPSPEPLLARQPVLEFQGSTPSDKPDNYIACNADPSSQHCHSRCLPQDNSLTPSPHPSGTSRSIHSARTKHETLDHQRPLDSRLRHLVSRNSLARGFCLSPRHAEYRIKSL
jgi:hypothetical protein